METPDTCSRDDTSSDISRTLVAAVASGFPINASTEYDANHSCRRAVLHQTGDFNGSNCWSAGINDANQNISVCLINTRKVVKIAI